MEVVVAERSSVEVRTGIRRKGTRRTDTTTLVVRRIEQLGVPHTKGSTWALGAAIPNSPRPVVVVVECMNKWESQAYHLALDYRGRLGRVLGLGAGG